MTEQYDKAVATAEHGVALNPNSADVHMLPDQTLRFAARHEEAIPLWYQLFEPLSIKEVSCSL